MHPLRTIVASAFLITALSSATAGAVDLSDHAIELELLSMSDGELQPVASAEQSRLFNAASCACEPPLGVRVRLVGPPRVLPSVPVEVWVGQRCDDTADLAVRDVLCTELIVIDDINDLRNSRIIEFARSDLFGASGLDCGPDVVERGLFALVDDDGDNNYENAIEYTVIADTEPPPPVVGAAVEAIAEAAIVTWEIPPDGDDLAAFQVLCARSGGGGDEADAFPRAAPAFDTPYLSCDAEPTEVIDTMRACSDVVSATTDTVAITQLTPGVEYELVVVAIDSAGNATAIAAGTVTPTAEQGGCATTAGGGGAWAVLPCAALALALRRRRRSR